MRTDLSESTWKIFYKSFVAGTGWVFGVTVGFTLLISLLSFVMGQLGGLPVIGNFVASLVEVTKDALINRGF